MEKKATKMPRRCYSGGRCIRQADFNVRVRGDVREAGAGGVSERKHNVDIKNHLNKTVTDWKHHRLLNDCKGNMR